MDNGNLAVVAVLTFGLGLAASFAYIARRLYLPAVLGYLIAGYLIGPFSPGYVADITIAEQLAEVGVILMLFGVGLHFKLQDLLDVKSIAIPGAILQTLAALILTILISLFLDLTLATGVILGLSIGVASTVVMMRMLSDNHLLHTKEGHIAIGWLIVEDIFTVLILLLLPVLASLFNEGDFNAWMTLRIVSFAILKFIVFTFLMLTIGHKLVDVILKSVARLRSQELFILTVLALMFSIASLSSVVFGTSIALGAFISGMVIGKTSVKHQAAANALPLKDIFGVIFFISIGMLFNPYPIFEHFGLFLAVVSIILLAKPLVAFVITKFYEYPFRVALTVAFSLAQVGEFSFILSQGALNLLLIQDFAFDILVGAAIVTISLNPLLFEMIEPLSEKWSFSRRSRETLFKIHQVKHPFKPRVVVVGYGSVGKRMAELVKSEGFLPVIVEHDIDLIASVKGEFEAIYGDAREHTVLQGARLQDASYMILTLLDADRTYQIIEAARHVNPTVQIIARVNNQEDIPIMKDLKVHYVCTESEALKEFSQVVPRLLRSVK